MKTPNKPTPKLSIDDPKIKQACLEEQTRFLLIETGGKQFITEKETGLNGEVVKQGNKYAVTLINASATMPDKRKQGLEKRMTNWFVYTQLKKEG